VKFPLATFWSRTPVPSLGGGTRRYKPVIPILIMGPSGQTTTRILVDTGSDDIVFPHDIAERIGVDLRGASPGSASGVGSAGPVQILFAPVILELSDQVETCRWRAVVGFTRTPLRFSLLGIAGGLEHFETILRVRSLEVQLIPQSTLPSTSDPVP
jgi:hypothetical protein